MGEERARTRPKRRSRTAAVLLTAVVVGGAVYFLQQSRITSLRKSLSESQQAADDLENQLVAAQESLAAAEEEIVIVRGQLAEVRRQARQAQKRAESAGQPAENNATSENKKLPDGKYFGKFTYVQSPTHISVDMEELLYGREAQKTAVSDGAIPPGTKLPDGYYIRNVSSESRVFPVTRNVTVQILAEAGSSEKKTIEMPGLVKRWSNPMQKYKHLRTGEYDFWLNNQRIVRIVQHYFP